MADDSKRLFSKGIWIMVNIYSAWIYLLVNQFTLAHSKCSVSKFKIQGKSENILCFSSVEVHLRSILITWKWSTEIRIRLYANPTDSK